MLGPFKDINICFKTCTFFQFFPQVCFNKICGLMFTSATHKTVKTNEALFTSMTQCANLICVFLTLALYCWYQLCIVYISCVLFTSAVYCLHQLCFAYISCVLFTSAVHCLHQLCIVYISFALFTSVLYCLNQWCICLQCTVYIWGVLLTPME